MKKPVLFLAAALAVSAVQASAMTEVTDADGNGSFSMEEMVAGYPDLTEEQFAAVDADGSGDVSEEEMAAAVEAGVLGN